MSVTRVAIIGTAGRRDAAGRLSAAHFTAMVSLARTIIERVLLLHPSQVHLVSGGSSYADHVAVALYLQSIGGQDGKAASETAGPDESYAGLTLHLPTAFHTTSTSTAITTEAPFPSPLPIPSAGLSNNSPRRVHPCGCALTASYVHPHFLDNGSPSWKTNPGRVLNRYHAQFNSAMSGVGGAGFELSSAADDSKFSDATCRAPFTTAAARFSSFHDLYTALALGAELRTVAGAADAPTASGQRISVQRYGTDAFHSRNSLVAESEHLIAFTFGGSLLSSTVSASPEPSMDALSMLLSCPSNQPSPGGTADTWRKCRGNKVHVPLDHVFSAQLARCAQSFASATPPAARQLPSLAPPVRSPTSRFCLAAASVMATSATAAGTLPIKLPVSYQRRPVKRRCMGKAEERNTDAVPNKRLLTSWLHC